MKLNTKQVLEYVKSVHASDPARYITPERVQRRLESVGHTASVSKIKRAIAQYNKTRS